MDSGEESDEYVMRVYQQMIDNESSDKPKNKSTKSETTKSKARKPPKSANKVMEEETTNHRSAHKSNDSKDLNELREECERLEGLLDRNKKETRYIINKASELKQKDKTACMQVVELLKLNTYLMSHLPDSERILEEYHKIARKDVSNSRSMTASTSKDSSRSSSSKAFKSPVVNPISNYFRSVDKSNTKNINGRNGNNSNASDTDCDDMPLNKLSTSRQSSSQSKSRQRRQLSGNEDSDEKEEDMAETSSRRASPRKKGRVDTVSKRVSPRKKQTVNTESDNESDAKEHNESKVSKRSSSGYRSSAETNEKKSGPKKKESAEKPKRKRRRRVDEPRGLFPCTFDPRQCDEIMDTKEHFDFHMSGHYDAKYVCPFCAYTGPTIQIIKRHLNKEREAALKDVKEKKPLTVDRRTHKDVKIYQCFGCKVCDKIHDKLERRCEHIKEDNDNQCDFMHDMDYEFKDHLKMHFADKFRNIKDKDERKQKIKAIVDKFVEEQYFENNAKKEILVEKFNKSKESQLNKTTDKTEGKTDGKPDKKTYQSDSDSDWD